MKNIKRKKRNGQFKKFKKIKNFNSNRRSTIETPHFLQKHPNGLEQSPRIAYRSNIFFYALTNRGNRRRERETEKGKKEIKIARNNRLVSNSLRLPCRILAGSGFDAHLPISPIKYHLPLSPPPFSFPTFSIQSARTRERGGRRFVAITSDLARICGGYSVKTRPNFSSFFVFYLQEKNH